MGSIWTIHTQNGMIFVEPKIETHTNYNLHLGKHVKMNVRALSSYMKKHHLIPLIYQNPKPHHHIISIGK
ncbi:MAG: hypothetical protein EBR82_71830, partial [Caulobacteraceae bacterium]|nr:hypothetical protein [Caulobacteraceae bacterium]